MGFDRTFRVLRWNGVGGDGFDSYRSLSLRLTDHLLLLSASNFEKMFDCDDMYDGCETRSSLVLSF